MFCRRPKHLVTWHDQPSVERFKSHLVFCLTSMRKLLTFCDVLLLTFGGWLSWLPRNASRNRLKGTTNCHWTSLVLLKLPAVNSDLLFCQHLYNCKLCSLYWISTTAQIGRAAWKTMVVIKLWHFWSYDVIRYDVIQSYLVTQQLLPLQPAPAFGHCYCAGSSLLLLHHCSQLRLFRKNYVMAGGAFGWSWCLRRFASPPIFLVCRFFWVCTLQSQCRVTWIHLITRRSSHSCSWPHARLQNHEVCCVVHPKTKSLIVDTLKSLTFHSLFFQYGAWKTASTGCSGVVHI